MTNSAVSLRDSAGYLSLRCCHNPGATKISFHHGGGQKWRRGSKPKEWRVVWFLWGCKVFLLGQKEAWVEEWMRAPVESPTFCRNWQEGSCHVVWFELVDWELLSVLCSVFGLAHWSNADTGALVKGPGVGLSLPRKRAKHCSLDADAAYWWDWVRIASSMVSIQHLVASLDIPSRTFRGLSKRYLRWWGIINGFMIYVSYNRWTCTWYCFMQIVTLYLMTAINIVVVVAKEK